MGSYSRQLVLEVMGDGMVRKESKLSRRRKAGGKLAVACKTSGPFASLFAAAVRFAKGRDLQVLVDGVAVDPVWRISCARSGAFLMLYWPLNRIWQARGQREKCAGWREALKLAEQVRASNGGSMA